MTYCQSETPGTSLYRLRTPPAQIGRALLVVVLRRGHLRAAERVTGHNSETLRHEYLA